jgi:hypothetical protein
MQEKKICPECKTEKLITDFYFAKKNQRLTTPCKECRRTKYHKTYDPVQSKLRRERSRQLINNTKRKIVARHKAANLEWLKGHFGADKLHCDRCKYDKSFAAIHLHHLRKEEKTKKTDQLSNWLSQYKLTTFQEKILSTNFVLLCANCHAELHAGVWSL